MGPSPWYSLATVNNFLGMDGLILLVIGLLLFGRRLPEMGKNVGRTIVEFKKGLSGAYDAAGEEPANDTPVHASPAHTPRPPRISVKANLDPQPRTRTPRKNLPQTEEV